MSLLTLRAAIVEGIAKAVPGLRTCQAHPGRFEAGELKRYAVASPAVLVACLGVGFSEPLPTGETNLAPRWAAFVLTAERPGLPRDQAALALVEAILLKAADTRWPIDGHLGAEQASETPQELRAENLYSGTLDKQGVAVWSVTWRQGVTLGEADASALDDFLRFYADYDLAPTDGQVDATDHVELEGP